MKRKDHLPNDEAEEVKFVFRLPRELHAQVKDQANKDGRSMNSHLVQIVLDYYYEDRTILDKLDKIEKMIQRKLDKK